MQRQTWQQFTLLSIFMLFFNAISMAASDSKDKGKFLGAMQTEYPAWFKESFLDFKEDVAEAASNGKRLMVLFHQDGCPYCNVLIERNLAQKDIVDLMKKKFDVVALNMWGDREVASIGGQSYTEKTFAAALKVQFTPTILFFNEQGKIILRLNGYLPPDKFKVALDFIAGQHEKTTTYREYASKNSPQKSSGKLISQTFFARPPYDLKRDGKNAKPVAIFFEQTDCPNCETLHTKILINDEIQKTIRDFDAVQLDMWSDTPVIAPDGTKTTAKQLAKKLDIKFAPTIVVFNEQGKEIIRSEAFFKVFHTNGILTYVSSGVYKKEPSFQRYLTEVAHDIQASGKDVDIWSLEGEPAKK